MTKPAMSLLLLGIALSGSTHALDIDSFDTDENDRFENDASFILNDYDLSGVGKTAGGRWGSLVSENVFISAFHFPAPIGSVLRFYETNDPASASITRVVTAAEQISGSDIWIGVLNDPVPAGYAIYEFATETIVTEADFLASAYNGQSAFLIGQSPDSYTTTQDVAAGRNVLDGWDESFSQFGATGPAITSDIGGGSDVTYEAGLVNGDSGAPLFVDLDTDDADDTLRLVATNWYIGFDDNDVQNLNGFAYLGNYSTQIQNYIDANAVPEPSGFAALAIGGLLIMRRRRR